MSHWVRQAHRWLSIVFTGTVVANIVAISMGQEDATWVTYAPLPPLGLQLLSGLYLFALPYVQQRQGRRK